MDLLSTWTDIRISPTISWYFTRKFWKFINSKICCTLHNKYQQHRLVFSLEANESTSMMDVTKTFLLIDWCCWLLIFICTNKELSIMSCVTSWITGTLAIIGVMSHKYLHTWGIRFTLSVCNIVAICVSFIW